MYMGPLAVLFLSQSSFSFILVPFRFDSAPHHPIPVIITTKLGGKETKKKRQHTHRIQIEYLQPWQLDIWVQFR